jgi:hypothetical protein
MLHCIKGSTFHNRLSDCQLLPLFSYWYYLDTQITNGRMMHIVGLFVTVWSYGTLFFKVWNVLYDILSSCSILLHETTNLAHTALWFLPDQLTYTGSSSLEEHSNNKNCDIFTIEAVNSLESYRIQLYKHTHTHTLSMLTHQPVPFHYYS